MGIFSRFPSFRKNSGSDETKSGAISSRDLADMLASSTSAAGVGVSAASALQFSTVWACVRLLAETIATVPIHIFLKNKDNSKQRVTDIRAAEILSFAPNSWQTIFEYIDFIVTSLAMRGNSYAFVSRSSTGSIAELIPLAPSSVTVTRSGFDLSYRVIFDDGSSDIFGAHQIHHVRGMSLDGFTGVSPLSYHRNTIGLAIAAETHGGTLFRNGAMPAGSLAHPGKLSDEAYARIKKSWLETHGGDNQGGVAVLEEGLTFNPITMSNEDAQYLELRQFQRTEICSLYRVPPHMIGDLSKSSFSNITQQSLEMVKYTFLPWVRRLELAMRRDLLTDRERAKGIYIEFMLDGLERADIEQRYKTYNIGIMSGILSPDECRAKENLNPRPGGDIYLAPLNMADSTGGMPSATITASKSNVQKQMAPIETKGLLDREQLREQFAPRFRALAQALVKHEADGIREILPAAETPLGRDFSDGFAAIYASLPGYISAQFTGLMREYAVAVRDAALAEIGSDNRIDPAELSAFVGEMSESFASRHIGSSEGQIAALINELAEDEIAAAIEQRMTEWEQTRADKIAAREPVQQESAVARFVWAASGITKLQWQRRGSKSCPFCKSINGKIVGIDAPFIDQGDYTPDGHETSPLKVRGPKMHAPIHQGCVCVITPVQA